MGVFRQFPYSNFHEMNMDEIIKIIKNMLEEWATYHAEWDSWMNQMNDDWSNYQEVMNTAWQNMQDFINNYFDNLDVQNEINNKITSMVNSGAFSAIVDPYVPPAVSEWLAEHITTPKTVVIDDTLSIEGACADAKATGDAIDDVVIDLTRSINDIGTRTINLFDKNAKGIKDGYTMYSDGSEGGDPTRFISDFISTSGISTLYLYPSYTDYTRIVFYNSKDSSDINVVATTSSNAVSNSNNAPYMRFASEIAIKDSLCVSTTPTTEYAPYGYKKCTTTDEFIELADVVDDILDVVGDKFASFGTAFNFNDYISTATNATVRFSAIKTSNVSYLKQIKVKSSGSGTATIYLGSYVGTTYTFIDKFDVTLTSGVNTLVNGVDFDYQNELPINTIIGLGSSSISLYYLSGEQSLSIPVDNVLGTFTADALDYGVSINATIILKTDLDDIREDILDLQTARNVCLKTTNASLSNEVLELSATTAIKKKLNLTFFGTISAFNDLEIGFKYGATKYDRLIISNTSVVVANAISSNVHTYQHGLTIENNIAVMIEMKIDETADITIMSNGEIWTQNVSWFRMISLVSPYVTVTSSTSLTDCTLSMTCEDYNQRIYAYGDSYFNYEPERWMYYASQYGFANNMLLDAYAGEASAQAIICLAEDIKHGTPKYILWCLGMNDSSDSSSAYAANWKAGIDDMLAYCEQIHAVPILATIPSVATNGTVTRNNEKKNEWVRASGYRYIDFAKAVGADANGVWYDGMLEPTGSGVTERVHPTEKGAKALFMQACVDFPEMMVTN